MKQDDNSNKAVEERQVDYKGFLDEYLAARARYKESHSTADYKAMNECYNKYGIPQDERKLIATLLQMQDNTVHSDGKEVSRIPADVFEKSLTEGQWKEVIGTIKTNTDATAINEVTEGKYPVLGEIFKSDRKNANLVMQAFGLFKEDDNYVVRINPEKFHLYDYETFFAKDIKEVTEETNRQKVVVDAALLRAFEYLNANPSVTYELYMNPDTERMYRVKNTGGNNQQAEKIVIPIPKQTDLGTFNQKQAALCALFAQEQQYEGGIFEHVIIDKKRDVNIITLEGEDGKMLGSMSRKDNHILVSLPDGREVEMDIDKYIKEHQTEIQQKINKEMLEIKHENDAKISEAKENEIEDIDIYLSQPEPVSHNRENGHRTALTTFDKCLYNWDEYQRDAQLKDDMIRQHGGVIDKGDTTQGESNWQQFISDYDTFKKQIDTSSIDCPSPENYIFYLCEKNNISKEDLENFKNMGAMISYSNEYDQEIMRIPANEIDEFLHTGNSQESWNMLVESLSHHLLKGAESDYPKVNNLSDEICEITMKQGVFGLSKQGDEYILSASSGHIKRHGLFQADTLQEYYNNYLDYKIEKITAQEEEYLDAITDNLKDLKMTGKEIDNDALLGVDLQQGAELFGLGEFSPDLQTDILLSMAYLRSDAFQDRLRASLGYQKGETMTEEHQQIYDNASLQARKAYQKLSFERIDEIWDDNLTETMNGYVVQLSEEKQSSAQIINGSQTAAHEIAHAVYNDFGAAGLDPGAVEDSKASYYGKENSPYNKITASPSDPVRTAQFYQKVIAVLGMPENDKVDHEKVEKMVDIVKNGDTSVLEPFLEHDEEGCERAADVHAARMEMLHRGIYNPFSGEPLTDRHIRQLYKANPDNRIFNYWNFKEAVYFLRNIAQNGLEQRTDNDLRQELNRRIQDQLAEIPERKPSQTEGRNVSQAAVTIIDRSDLVSAAYQEKIAELEKQEQTQDRGLRV